MAEWTRIGEPVKRGWYRYVRCRCSCGTEKAVRMLRQTDDQLSSTCCFACGNKGKVTHGHASKRSRTYTAYHNMLRRCYSPTNEKYPRYGGRGIRVCKRWRGPAGFSNFVTDMGDAPSGMQIDRIDNDGNYESGNCRWATRIQQARNKSATLRLTYDGTSKSVTQWADDRGLKASTVHARLRRGWSVEQALTRPPRTWGR